MDCSSSGSSVHGFSRASVLEWVAISISKIPFFTCQITPNGRVLLHSIGRWEQGICLPVPLTSSDRFGLKVISWSNTNARMPQIHHRPDKGGNGKDQREGKTLCPLPFKLSRSTKKHHRVTTFRLI